MNKRPLYIPYAGPALLETPLLNKGSAFSESERQNFNLVGLLPHIKETIEEQKERAYEQLSSFKTDIDKHIYLRNIQDTNETLFYRLIVDHIEEVMPLIYTPTVGEACQQFSHIYRRSRGLFISYPDLENLDDMLQNATKRNVKVIVVTDGERILGLGDQGIGGMGIPIGKLSLYVACGGISPAYTLPVVLDAGCNNQNLINDPMYMGWRHPRITGDEYEEFVDEFIAAVKRRWPEVLLQFEDFAQTNAMPILNRYKDNLCCFNDDIQGTAAVTVGTLLAACKAKNERLCDQRVVFVGAGSAGCGIAEQIIAQMKSEGLSEPQARQQVFMVDRWGLLLDSMSNLRDFQKPLAQNSNTIVDWECTERDSIALLEVITNAKPTVLIGVSGQPGLFNEQVITSLHEGCSRPIVLPLSNPTSQVEAEPKDILRWTKGEAIVATGSPFAPVAQEGKIFDIAQCNNSYIFPGLGLGIVASKATRVTDNMLMATSRALAEASPLARDGEGPLLPSLEHARELSKVIAKAVYEQAMADGVANEVTEEHMLERIERNFWKPEYRRYRRVSF
ncbi:NAD-dependent malic enzyme [Marinibactrum halimedae]|uniref:NAD-dependent malic enzyme n=1 Tax=Marinibactrum halimedae TaxID=1444977 RepID=A0AA37T480_9GAMM|nr:NAD-dependent malic enzyme [Marinibactrum halimedae]MCD9459929.1 NAD-dependent malic enzyme [Marinibactrum halimedae]GLS25216.1 NAD-dependent malic enzyme [Marinibactrum halimedae]